MPRALKTFNYWIMTFFSHCNLNVVHGCEYIQTQCYANGIQSIWPSSNIPFNFWRLMWLRVCVTCFLNEPYRHHSSPKYSPLQNICDQSIMYHWLLLFLELSFHKFWLAFSALFASLNFSDKCSRAAKKQPMTYLPFFCFISHFPLYLLVNISYLVYESMFKIISKISMTFLHTFKNNFWNTFISYKVRLWWRKIVNRELLLTIKNMV